jgi:hypothetical protein
VIPHWYVALVLSLGAFRITRLIGWDDFPPIARLRAKATGESRYTNSAVSRDAQIIRYRRPTLEHFLHCPFCSGFWICVIVYLAWRFESFWTLTVLAPFALNAVVGITARNLDA